MSWALQMTQNSAKSLLKFASCFLRQAISEFASRAWASSIKVNLFCIFYFSIIVMLFCCSISHALLVIGGLAWAITASSIFLYFCHISYTLSTWILRDSLKMLTLRSMFFSRRKLVLVIKCKANFQIQLFEILTLGSKIGETIIKALQRMKCPHFLQTQQIRGNE